VGKSNWGQLYFSCRETATKQLKINTLATREHQIKDENVFLAHLDKLLWLACDDLRKAGGLEVGREQLARDKPNGILLATK
jgi:hypothetical protein